MLGAWLGCGRSYALGAERSVWLAAPWEELVGVALVWAWSGGGRGLCGLGVRAWSWGPEAWAPWVYSIPGVTCL